MGEHLAKERHHRVPPEPPREALAPDALVGEGVGAGRVEQPERVRRGAQQPVLLAGEEPPLALEVLDVRAEDGRCLRGRSSEAVAHGLRGDNPEASGLEEGREEGRARKSTK